MKTKKRAVMVADLTALILFVLGFAFNYYGLNDQFLPGIPNDTMTPAQLTNEICSTVSMVGGMVLWAVNYLFQSIMEEE